MKRSETEKKYIFSILAIVMPFIFFGVMYVMFHYFVSRIDPRYEYHVIGGVASLFALGVISSVISFFRNENVLVLKWLGALLNLAVILFYLTVIILE